MPIVLIFVLACLSFVTFAIGSGTNGLSVICAAAFLPICAMLYFSPTMAAAMNRRPNVGQIAVLNLFAGWTVLGWIAALVWAYGPARVEPQG